MTATTAPPQPPHLRGLAEVPFTADAGTAAPHKHHGAAMGSPGAGQCPGSVAAMGRSERCLRRPSAAARPAWLRAGPSSAPAPRWGALPAPRSQQHRHAGFKATGLPRRCAVPDTIFTTIPLSRKNSSEQQTTKSGADQHNISVTVVPQQHNITDLGAKAKQNWHWRFKDAQPDINPPINDKL